MSPARRYAAATYVHQRFPRANLCYVVLSYTWNHSEHQSRGSGRYRVEKPLRINPQRFDDVSSTYPSIYVFRRRTALSRSTASYRLLAHGGAVVRPDLPAHMEPRDTAIRCPAPGCIFLSLLSPHRSPAGGLEDGIRGLVCLGPVCAGIRAWCWHFLKHPEVRL